MNSEVIQELAIDRIKCEAQVRKHFEETKLNGIALSMTSVGQIYPIRVRPHEDWYITVDGEYRLRAAIKIGMTTIFAIVEQKDLSKGEVIQRQLVANCQRSDLGPLELACAIATLIETTKWHAKEAAVQLGLSESQVSRLLSLRSLPTAILQAVDSGRLPMSTAAEIAKINDPEKQITLARQAINGRLSRDAISGVVKRARTSEAAPERKSVGRVSVPLGSGRSVTISGAGLSLENLISWLEELLGKARKARTQAWELGTFVRALKDQTKA